MTANYAVVKRLLASNKISFIITALVVLCATSSGDVVLSNGNYSWLLAVFTPFFFVFYDFTRLMHLGTSKKDYFSGCLISYVFLAFCISVVNTIIHLLIDPVYPAQTVINLMDVCQWTKNGILVAGLQQMFFLLLVTLNVKNGNVSGTVVGSYDDFSIQSDIKKGESNLPDTKDGGGKTLHVSCNNGDVDIAFVSNE